MKYDLKAIMTFAWSNVKAFGWTISQALTEAWKGAKAGDTLGLSADVLKLATNVYHYGMQSVRWSFGGAFTAVSGRASQDLHFMCQRTNSNTATFQIEGVVFKVTQILTGRNGEYYVSIPKAA